MSGCEQDKPVPARAFASTEKFYFPVKITLRNMAANEQMKELAVRGEKCLEMALCYCILARRSVRISTDVNLGDKIYFLEFLKYVTVETSYKIVDRQLLFYPGTVSDGALKYFQQEDDMGSITEIFDALALLSLFTRSGIRLDYEGITNHNDRSIDMMKIASGKIFKAFQLAMPAVELMRRGFAPLGGGRASVAISSVRLIQPIDLREDEMLHKIRGLIVTAKVSAESTRRMVNAIKEHLEPFENLKISTVLNNRSDSGPSAGTECSVYAEGRRGIFYSTLNGAEKWEAMAGRCCEGLLTAIDEGVIFDGKLRPLLFSLMGLARGVSYLKIRELGDDDKELLELLKSIFNIRYYVSADETGGPLLKIVGAGYTNPHKLI